MDPPPPSKLNKTQYLLTGAKFEFSIKAKKLSLTACPATNMSDNDPNRMPSGAIGLGLDVSNGKNSNIDKRQSVNHF